MVSLRFEAEALGEAGFEAHDTLGRTHAGEKLGWRAVAGNMVIGNAVSDLGLFLCVVKNNGVNEGAILLGFDAKAQIVGGHEADMLAGDQDIGAVALDGGKGLCAGGGDGNLVAGFEQAGAQEKRSFDVIVHDEDLGAHQRLLTPFAAANWVHNDFRYRRWASL